MIKIIIPKWETLVSVGIVSTINGREMLSVKDLYAYLVKLQPKARNLIIALIQALPLVMKRNQYEEFRSQYKKSSIRTNSRHNCRIVLEEDDDDV